MDDTHHLPFTWGTHGTGSWNKLSRTRTGTDSMGGAGIWASSSMRFCHPSQLLPPWARVPNWHPCRLHQAAGRPLWMPVGRMVHTAQEHTPLSAHVQGSLWPLQCHSVTCPQAQLQVASCFPFLMYSSGSVHRPRTTPYPGKPVSLRQSSG